MKSVVTTYAYEIKYYVGCLLAIVILASYPGHPMFLNIAHENVEKHNEALYSNTTVFHHYTTIILYSGAFCYCHPYSCLLKGDVIQIQLELMMSTLKYYFYYNNTMGISSEVRRCMCMQGVD